MANIGNTVVHKVLGKTGIVQTKSGVADGKIFILPAPYANEQTVNGVVVSTPPEAIVYTVKWADGSVSEVQDTDLSGSPGLNNNGSLVTDGRNILPSSDTLIY